MSPVQNESNIPVGALLVGKYRVTREIGRGGMAAVYEADHLALTKKVAIKVLASELTGSAVVIERFFREARAAASVKSPHIVDIYDSGKLEDGRPYFVMEYADRGSLADRMAERRAAGQPFTVDEALDLSIDIAEALAVAHGLGVVHRDLKPSNVMYRNVAAHHRDTRLERMLLADFGIARVTQGNQAATIAAGTPHYMAPEQSEGHADAVCRRLLGYF